MLKVENLTFEVNEEGKKRCLVNHISFERCRMGKCW